jgi:hypothetical protein
MPLNPRRLFDGTEHSKPRGDERSLDSGRGLIFSGHLPALATHFTERSTDLSLNRRRIVHCGFPAQSCALVEFHIDRSFQRPRASGRAHRYGGAV